MLKKPPEKHHKRPGRHPRLRLVVHPQDNLPMSLREWLESLPPGGTLQVVRDKAGRFQ